MTPDDDRTLGPELNEIHTVAIAIGMLRERNRIDRHQALQILHDLAINDRYNLAAAASVVINTKV
jgi:hypothetical protein